MMLMRLETSPQSGTEMKKQFSSIATLGLAFSILNSWVGAAGSLLGPISLGGSVTAIWGCLAGAAFTTILCMGVIEMASAMPGAGGPYHYTFVLAWEHNRKFLVWTDSFHLSLWNQTIPSNFAALEFLRRLVQYDCVVVCG